MSTILTTPITFSQNTCYSNSLFCQYLSYLLFEVKLIWLVHAVHVGCFGWTIDDSMDHLQHTAWIDFLGVVPENLCCASKLHYSRHLFGRSAMDEGEILSNVWYLSWIHDKWTVARLLQLWKAGEVNHSKRKWKDSLICYYSPQNLPPWTER